MTAHRRDATSRRQFLSTAAAGTAAFLGAPMVLAARKTDMVVGRWHGHHVNLPIGVVTVRRRKVGLQGDLWLSVLEATGQPAHFGP